MSMPTYESVSLSAHPDSSFRTGGGPFEGLLNIEIERQGLEELLDQGVNERVISDQLVVANRIDSLLGGLRGWLEDRYASLGKWVSGNSRHSFVLMCSYGEGSPLNDLNLGRYGGNDFLKGEPMDLMGRDGNVREVLRGIRSREGIGSLVINGHFGLYHSGVQIPNIDISGYQEDQERGSKTEAMLVFSKKHPTYSDNPVWFYRLNGHRSIIQNGREYMLDASMHN